MKICPTCHTENPRAASFCRHCRYEFPEETKSDTSISPKILYFKLLEDKYTIGSAIRLEWNVVNAKIVKLNETEVPAIGSSTLKVENAETMALIAENDYDKAVRNIRITPRPQPAIRSFSTSQTSIRAGQEVKFKWETKNCFRLVLRSSKDDVDVTNKPYYKVLPSQTDIYTLVGYAEDENIYVERELQVSVIFPVQITRFVSDQSVIAESDKAVLSWETENATSIVLYPMMKDVTNLHQYEVNPSRTIEYRLIATNGLSQAEAALSVGVRPLPKIDLKFADALAKIEMPSCDVNLSFLSEDLKKARVDEWMMTRPIENIRFSVWKNTIASKFKEVINLFRR